MPWPPARSTPTGTLDTLGGRSLQVASVYDTVAESADLWFSGPEREVLASERSEDEPEYVGLKHPVRKLRVQHRIYGDTHAAQMASLNRLKREHYSRRFGARTLVLTDGDGQEKQVTVQTARVIASSTGLEYGAVDAEWTVLSHVKLSTTEQTASVVGATSDITLTLDNDGDEYSPAVKVELTPTAQKAPANGQRYRYPITLVNRQPWPIRAPICVTDDYAASPSPGWDHATEVTATRSQADGDDVELYQNHRRLMRWADAWNGATTRIFSEELFLPAARFWTYNGGANLGAAATTMSVREDLRGMPPLPFYAALVKTPALQEVVRVTAYDAEKRQLSIVRGTRGTSGQIHADGTKLYWCPPECLLELVYGGTSLPAPDYVDDDYQPMFDLGSSDNGKWVFSNFQETEAASRTQDRKPRAASWATRDHLDRSREKKTAEGDRYLRYIPRTATLSTDVAAAVKMCLAYRSAGALDGHPLMSMWEIVVPFGITSIDYTQDTTTLDFATAREAELEVVAVGRDGAEEQLATHSGGTSSPSQTPSSNAYAVQFRIKPFDPKIDSTTVEILAGEPTDADGFTVDAVTLNFDSSEEVLVIWGASRESVYQLGRPDDPLTIANSDADTLQLAGPVVALNETLTVDVSARSVTFGDGTGGAHLATGTWPEAPPDDGGAGTTDFTVSDTTWGTVDATGRWRDAWS